jgi:AraC family transcriptional regulator, regulatory protein of adaptative response / DNA-3-methyladenine glycosylase II
MRLEFHPPFDWDALLAFLAGRAVPGIESVERGRYLRTIAFGQRRGWVTVGRAAHSPAALEATFAPSLAPARELLAARLRTLLDLDAQPVAIAAHLSAHAELATHVRRRPGLRVPGAVDGFELATRAILGQQVSVQAARTLAGRVAAAFGEPAAVGHPGLNRFPVPAHRLADAPPERVAALGMPRARAECLVQLARLVAEGSVRLEPGAPVQDTLARLQDLRGIGPWTAQYIAMRALHWPDAFPHSDLGVRKALGRATPAQVLRVAEAWRPWRAYAVLHLWQGLSDTPKGKGAA